MGSAQDMENMEKAWARATDAQLYDALANPDGVSPEGLRIARSEFERRSLPDDKAAYAFGEARIAAEHKKTSAFLTAVPHTVWWFDLSGAIAIGFSVVTGLWTAVLERHLSQEDARLLAFCGFFLCQGVAAVALAAAMERKKRWARLVGFFYAVYMLFFFPAGTLVGIACLVRLASSGADQWFSGVVPDGVDALARESLLNRTLAAIFEKRQPGG